MTVRCHDCWSRRAEHTQRTATPRRRTAGPHRRDPGRDTRPSRRARRGPSSPVVVPRHAVPAAPVRAGPAARRAHGIRIPAPTMSSHPDACRRRRPPRGLSRSSSLLRRWPGQHRVLCRGRRQSRIQSQRSTVVEGSLISRVQSHLEPRIAAELSVRVVRQREAAPCVELDDLGPVGRRLEHHTLQPPLRAVSISASVSRRPRPVRR